MSIDIYTYLAPYVSSEKFLLLYIRRVNRILSRTELENGFEIHHILPRTIFPEFNNLLENKWNRLVCSYRDHYILHFLLAKAIGGTMQYAFNMMHTTATNEKSNRYFNPILYEILRAAFHLTHHNTMIGRKRIHKGDENKLIKIEELQHWIEEGWQLGDSDIMRKRKSDSLKGNKKMLGKTHTKETKAKIGKAHKNKRVSEETRKKLSIAGKNNPKPSKETREKLSIAGKNKSQSTIEKQRESMIGRI